MSILCRIESQYRIDVGYVDKLRDVFGFSDSKLYDNSGYLSSVLDLLRVYFPVGDDGFCEIEHWCFVLDFGKCGDEYESPSELYDRLVYVLYESELEKNLMYKQIHIADSKKTLGID